MNAHALMEPPSIFGSPTPGMITCGAEPKTRRTFSLLAGVSRVSLICDGLGFELTLAEGVDFLRRESNLHTYISRHLTSRTFMHA